MPKDHLYDKWMRKKNTTIVTFQMVDIEYNELKNELPIEVL